MIMKYYQIILTSTSTGCDRADRSGGGVLNAVSKTIPCHIVSVQSVLEIVRVSVKWCYGSILFGISDRPPNASREVCDCICDDLSFLAAHCKTYFLYGDFNLPGTDWNTLTPTSSG